MKQEFTFSKNFWGLSYELKNGDQIIGTANRESSFSTNTTVNLNHKTFYFNSKGLSPGQTSEQIDIYTENATIIGTVSPSIWESKATVFLKDVGVFSFKRQGMFSEDWEMSSGSESILSIKKKVFSQKGTVTVHKEDDLLLVIGMFLMLRY
jgi:uncharacterized protein YxjI